MAFSTLSAPATQLIAAHSSAHNHPKLSLSAAAATFSFPATHNGHSSSGLVSISAPCNDPKWRASVSFFPGFLKLNKTKDPEPIKEELFEALAPLDRGADATPEDQEQIEQIVRKLEAANPTKEPLKSPFLNGKWELIYTTSQSILQTNRPKFLRSRTNYQGINADTLRAQNLESWPTFNQARAIVQNQGDAQKPRQQATLMGLSPKKIELISCEPMAHVSDIKLIRTDTTLDLSQKAEKVALYQIVRKLEAANPTKEPLKSPFLNGKWELIYTTSQSILQTNRPKFLRSRTNYQGINADTLRAQNLESWPTFNQVTADLTPVNASKVAVKFDYFKIAGLIPIKAPDRARGSLDITYLDKELRVSRGDKGNLFILKMVDPSYRVPV